MSPWLPPGFRRPRLIWQALCASPIIKSQISASYSADVPISNPESLRYWAESAIRAVTDTLGFTNGCGYDVEITQFFEISNGVHLVFDVDQIIAAMNVRNRLSVIEVVKLHNSPAAVFCSTAFQICERQFDRRSMQQYFWICNPSQLDGGRFEIDDIRLSDGRIGPRVHGLSFSEQVRDGRPVRAHSQLRRLSEFSGPHPKHATKSND